MSLGSMNDTPAKRNCPEPILALAVSALALISLFWAIVLIYVLLQRGSNLVEIAAGGNKEPFPWTALFSGVIALCALVVSAGSLYFTRKHQRLSVKPQLEIVLATGPAENAHTKREICVRNYGLGPARITDYHFDFGDGVVASNATELHTLLTSRLNFPSALPKTYLLSLLPVERTEPIFWFEPPRNTNEEYQLLLSFGKLRKSLRLTVTYESMYNEVSTVTAAFDGQTSDTIT